MHGTIESDVKTLTELIFELLNITNIPIGAEFTTQAAAEFLGCSRSHVVKLLKNGIIPFTLIGRHRRIKFEDLRKYKIKMKETQRERLIQLMGLDEEAGIYHS